MGPEIRDPGPAGAGLAGRLIVSVALLGATVLALSSVWLVAFMFTCAPEENGDGIPQPSKCDGVGFASTGNAVVLLALLAVTAVLVVAAQRAYWERRWSAAGLLTAEAFVPGIALAAFALLFP